MLSFNEIEQKEPKTAYLNINYVKKAPSQAQIITD